MLLPLTFHSPENQSLFEMECTPLNFLPKLQLYMYLQSPFICVLECQLYIKCTLCPVSYSIFCILFVSLSLLFSLSPPFSLSWEPVGRWEHTAYESCRFWLCSSARGLALGVLSPWWCQCWHSSLQPTRGTVGTQSSHTFISLLCGFWFMVNRRIVNASCVVCVCVCWPVWNRMCTVNFFLHFLCDSISDCNTTSKLSFDCTELLSHCSIVWLIQTHKFFYAKNIADWNKHFRQ